MGGDGGAYVKILGMIVSPQTLLKCQTIIYLEYIQLNTVSEYDHV